MKVREAANNHIKLLEDLVSRHSQHADSVRRFMDSETFAGIETAVASLEPMDRDSMSVYYNVSDGVSVNFYLYNGPRHSMLPHALSKELSITFKKQNNPDVGQMLTGEAEWSQGERYFVNVYSYLTPGCTLREVTRTREVKEYIIDCGSDAAPA